MTMLSLVLPCYNEADRLPAALDGYLAWLPGDPGVVEVLVVDDGSTDATPALADAVAAGDPRVRVIRAGPNRGKGAAVRAGMLAADGALVAFTDADGSYGPGEVDRVVRALDRAPVAIGVRPAGATAAPPLRRVASQVFNGALRGLLDLPYHDTQCGVKAFRRDAARALFSRAQVDGYAFDAEVLVLAGRLGLAVEEVPVRAEQREGSKVNVFADGWRMLAETLAVRQALARSPAGLSGRSAPEVEGVVAAADPTAV
jgi:glycosyltransferase involved in cell wall biosynthesis